MYVYSIRKQAIFCTFSCCSLEIVSAAERQKLIEQAKESVIEVGADGKLRLKKKKIDLKDFDDDTLRKLGIDPNLSKQEITRRLKVSHFLFRWTEEIKI